MNDKMSNDDKKKKLMKYSKEVLSEYILQHMFFNFNELDLIKNELELNIVYKLQDKERELCEEFKQLTNNMVKETDHKKLNNILKQMKTIKTDIEKNQNKIRKLLLR